MNKQTIRLRICPRFPDIYRSQKPIQLNNGFLNTGRLEKILMKAIIRSKEKSYSTYVPAAVKMNTIKMDATFTALMVLGSES